MAEDRRVIMYNVAGSLVIIEYSVLDHVTYVYQDGVKVLSADGDIVDDQIDAYTDHGWTIEPRVVRRR